MRKLEADEREQRVLNKQLNAAEATHVIVGIEAAKRDKFEQKKNDHSNKLQTIAMQEEVAHKIRENVQSQHSVKAELRQNLNEQANEKAQRSQLEKAENLQGDIATTGFEFECYTRDPQMKDEARRTSGFQRGQQDADRFRRQQERQSEVAPDGTTLSNLEIDAIRQKAVEQEYNRRAELNQVMRNQYNDTISQKQREAAEARRAEEAAARQAAQLNAEHDRFEREQLAQAKREYDQILGQQFQQEQLRKQREVEERRYDPNVFTYHNAPQ